MYFVFDSRAVAFVKTDHVSGVPDSEHTPHSLSLSLLPDVRHFCVVRSIARTKLFADYLSYLPIV